jgi:hypothetical protein
VLEKNQFIGQFKMEFGNSLHTIDRTTKGKLLTKKSPPTKPEIIQKNQHHDSKVSVEIKEIFSVPECQEILKNASKYGFSSLSTYSKDQRDSSRLCIFDENLSSTLWYRLEKIIGQISNNKTHPFGFDVNGVWKPFFINNCFRLSKYEKDSIGFTPHLDSQFSGSFHLKSIFSLVIYLNDDFQGGETNFYSKENLNIDLNSFQGLTLKEEIKLNGGLKNYDSMSIKPLTGNGVLFNHDILHSGEKIEQGTKYVLRTDVVFHRVKVEKSIFNTKLFSLCTDLFREAQNQELDGNIKKSSDLYERSLSIRRFVTKYESSKEISLMEENLDVQDAWLIVYSFLSMNDQLSFSKVCKKLRSSFFASNQLFWEGIKNKFYKDEIVKQKNVKDYCLEKVNSSIVPILMNRIGKICEFEYEKGFFEKNEEACLRTIAMYAISLFGNNSHSIVVEYDPERKIAKKCSLEWILTCAFYELPCNGSFFHLNTSKSLDITSDEITKTVSSSTFDYNTSEDEDEEDDEDEDEDEKNGEETEKQDEEKSEEKKEDRVMSDDDFDSFSQFEFPKKRLRSEEETSSNKRVKKEDEDAQDLFETFTDATFIEKKYNSEMSDSHFVDIGSMVTNKTEFEKKCGEFANLAKTGYQIVHSKFGKDHCEICNCGLGNEYFFKGNDQKTKFNNLIVDFERNKLKVEEQFFEEENVFKIFHLGKSGERMFIAELENLKLKGFNHASCNCESEYIKHYTTPVNSRVFEKSHYLSKMAIHVALKGNFYHFVTEYYGVIF